MSLQPRKTVKPSLNLRFQTVRSVNIKMKGFTVTGP